MIVSFAASWTEKDTDLLREMEYGNFRGDMGKLTVREPPVGHLGSGYKAVVIRAILG